VRCRAKDLVSLVDIEIKLKNLRTGMIRAAYLAVASLSMGYRYIQNYTHKLHTARHGTIERTTYARTNYSNALPYLATLLYRAIHSVTLLDVERLVKFGQD
jgi:hypothetical protein